MCRRFRCWALVFVEALDLHVEERVGAHRDAALVLDDPGEALLVRALHSHEVVLELRVVREGLERAQLVEITLPAAADLRRDEIAQARVAGEEPAARRDAVCLVVELAG